MSARLTPEELRRIAPNEYAKQYGEEDAERARIAEMRAETRRLNAETRLLNARRRNARAKKPEPPRKPARARRRESPAAVIRWAISIAVVVAQFAIAWYIMGKY